MINYYKSHRIALIKIIDMYFGGSHRGENPQITARRKQERILEHYQKKVTAVSYHYIIITIQIIFY